MKVTNFFKALAVVLMLIAYGKNSMAQCPDNYYNVDRDCDGHFSQTEVYTCGTFPMNFGGCIQGNFYYFVGDDCDDLEWSSGNVCVGPSNVINYADADDDGYGAGPAIMSQSLRAGCSANNLDCDDLNETIHPGAAEICDGIDNDCDGVIDGTKYYADADGDGHGDPGSSPVTVGCGDSPPAGTAPNNDDSDDSDPHTHPGAKDICDGLDNDGDGQTDEDGDIVYLYLDQDGDGYGELIGTIEIACSSGGGGGYTPGPDTMVCVNDGDCFVPDPNDNCDNNNPAEETCNGTDDDCDGLTDDADTNVSGTTEWWRDNDGDGFGDALQAEQDVIHSCTQPSGYVSNNTDPDDINSTIYPGAPEICGDGLDNDGDGTTDEPEIPTPLSTDISACYQAVCIWSDAHMAGYKLRYKESGGSWLKVPGVIHATSHTISGLVAGKGYKWEVRGQCNSSVSDWSSRQKFTTKSIGCRLVDDQSTELITNKVRVYPNPAVGRFIVEINAGIESDEDAVVQVSNMMGQMIYDQKLPLANGETKKEIELKNVPSGIYYVRVVIGGQQFRSQIVINK